MLLYGSAPISRRAALLLLSTSVRGMRGETGSLTKRDLIPAFLQVWKEPDTTPAEMPAERFLKLVVQPNIDLYDAFVGTVSVERAARYLERVRPLVAAIESLDSWVAADFDAKLRIFRKSLPDFKWEGLVVFMPCLFVTDAGGGLLNGKDVLLFGLDTIAKVDGPQADLSVLMSHELFHKYYSGSHPEEMRQTRGSDIRLYRLVWTEGLATYASQRLNPQASQASIFRSATLASACEEHLGSLAAALLEDLDSTEKTPFMEWMSAQHRSSDVPPRAGYYFGWRVASALGRDRSLPELARLDDAEVRAGMVRELQRLRDGRADLRV